MIRTELFSLGQWPGIGRLRQRLGRRRRPAASAAGFSLVEVLIYFTLASTIMAGIIVALISNIRSNQRLELKQRAENVQGRLVNLIENEVREGSEICRGVGCGNPDPLATGASGNNALGVFRGCLNNDASAFAGVNLNDPTLNDMLFTIVIPVTRTMSKTDFLKLQRQYISSATLTEIPTLTPTVFGYNAVYVHYAQFTDPATGQKALFRCGPPIKADGSLNVDENAKPLPLAQLTVLHMRTTLQVDSRSFPITDSQVSTYRKGNELIYRMFIYAPPPLGGRPLFSSSKDLISRTTAAAIDPSNATGVDD